MIEQQLTYFCGSAPECRQIGNEKALKLAKYNAEMYYSVIGVTEHMRISLAIFEEYFPRYILISNYLYIFYRLFYVWVIQSINYYYPK